MPTQQEQQILFLGLTKTQFMATLIVILALSTVGQAWTIFTTTHLADTQRSLCHIVADANAGIDQTRGRLQAGAERYRAEENAANDQALAWARVQRQIKGSGLDIRPIIKNWETFADLKQAAARDLDAQAANTKAVTLAGC